MNLGELTALVYEYRECERELDRAYRERRRVKGLLNQAFREMGGRYYVTPDKTLVVINRLGEIQLIEQEVKDAENHNF